MEFNFLDYENAKQSEPCLDQLFSKPSRKSRERHPWRVPTVKPSMLVQDAFVRRFGGIFEHSAWIAERVFEDGLGPAHDTAIGLHDALAGIFRAATAQERLDVLTAHPDLAGKLAAAKRLTADSTTEQAGAGLDDLTDAERAAFSDLNERYTAKFGFPLIIAVRDHDKSGILAAFERPDP